ncbi:MAG: hypothetical protein KGZ39_08225 [Simkania sp.]|nr:hypothetical protein [Simkania sp.]
MTTPLCKELVPYFSINEHIKNKQIAEQDALREAKLIQLFRSLIIIDNPIAEAFQAEAIVSHALDDKPIIASYGAGPCVIICGYEPDQKVGFIAHFSHFGEVSPGTQVITTVVKRFLKHSLGNFIVDLKGGITSHPISAKIFDAIKIWTKTSKDISLQIRSSDPLESANDASRSIALDTRNGMIKDYDPLRDNPKNYRRLTTEDIHWARRSFDVLPQIKLVHPGTKKL